MNDLVSVIIPVYKTERYLDECVESIVNQTYKNLEIILVDDGSPDKCSEMCDKWAQKDNRIRVIHKQNGGLSDARNVAIDMCNGKYVLFVDSDDYYEKSNHIELIMKMVQSTGSDIVCFNYKRYYEDKNTFSEKLCQVTGDNNLSQMVKDNSYTSSACLKLIRKKLINNNNIYFEKGVYSEDIEFSAKLLLRTDKIAFCDAAVYVYRSRSDSITTSIKKKNIIDIYNIVSKLAESNTKDKNYWCYTAFQYCTLLINMNFDKIDAELKNKIYSLKWLLRYDENSKVKLIHTVSRVRGIKCTSKLLYVYFRLVN